MDEYNPNNAHTDSDTDDYLLMLQQMQDSLLREDSAEDVLPTFDAELTDEDLPLSSALLSADALTPPVLQEPEFDNLYATTGELSLNGHHEADASNWAAMPTQPLVLPADYLNGSGFAAFDEPTRNIEMPAALVAETELEEPTFDNFAEITDEPINFGAASGADSDSSDFAAEMPTGFALEAADADLDITAPLSFVPPIELENPAEELFTPSVDDNWVGKATQANDFTFETAATELETVEPADILITEDVDFPAALQFNSAEAAPEPEFDSENSLASSVVNSTENLVENPVEDGVFNAQTNVNTPTQTGNDELFAFSSFVSEEDAGQSEAELDEMPLPTMFDAPDDEAAMPAMLEESFAAATEEPVFDDDFALPETNFLTGNGFAADLTSEPLPEPSFVFEPTLEDDALETPDLMLLAQNEAATKDELPVELTIENEEIERTSNDFIFGEETDVLETPAPPVALRGVSVEDEELPQPEAFEEFPSFISDEDVINNSQAASEFPEHLEINSLSSTETPENAPAAAFPNLDAPVVLPNDFSQNGKHDYQATAQPAAEVKNGTEQTVKTSSAVNSTTFLEDRYIVFRIEEVLYAFSAKSIVEIGQPLPITPLPFVPKWFLGISNLRGDILSVVGLRELWNRKSAPAQQRTKLLVLRSEKLNVTVGLVVDGVREMRRVNADEINQNAAVEAHLTAYKIGDADYEGQRLALLDAEKFLESLKG